MSTYTPIASQVLTSDTSSIIFTGIPQNYQDLVIVIKYTTTATANLDMRIGYNTINSSAIYSQTNLWGRGNLNTQGSAKYQNASEWKVDYWQTGSSNPRMSIINLMNYANNYAYKTYLGQTGASADDSTKWIGSYQSTSPINQIQFLPPSGNIGAGSTVNLYGIVTGNGYANGGNIVVTDGTYWYHAFTSSGTFIPNENLTADVLVIAGGGGAGGTYGQGGGGAGGLIYSTSQSLTRSTVYAATVGSGGSGAIEYAAKGSSSNLTGGSLSLTTALGGGASAGPHFVTDGGSGAGGTYTDGTNGWYAGLGTSGQGNNGGLGLTTGGGDKSSGGGGGGAGAVGSNAGSTQAGAGGIGSSSYSSWGSATKTGQLSSGTYYYAGGGGGGTDNRVSGNAGGAGGLGGGGAGGTNGAAGTAALANTGGGGGGGGYNPGGPGTAGGNGGSGIVIVRYAV